MNDGDRRAAPTTSTDGGAASVAGPAARAEMEADDGTTGAVTGETTDEDDTRSPTRTRAGTTADADAEPGFEPGSSSVGVGLTLVASLVAVLPLVVAPPALAAGAVGLVALGIGVRTDRPGVFGLGVTGLAAGVVLAGLTGAPPLSVLVSAAGTLLAWDVADTALVVGRQLGRDAPTARLEVVHATGTALVLSVGCALAYGVFRLVGGGRPTLALALLLLGATLLALALR